MIVIQHCLQNGNMNIHIFIIVELFPSFNLMLIAISRRRVIESFFLFFLFGRFLSMTMLIVLGFIPISTLYECRTSRSSVQNTTSCVYMGEKNDRHRCPDGCVDKYLYLNVDSVGVFIHHTDTLNNQSPLTFELKPIPNKPNGRTVSNILKHLAHTNENRLGFSFEIFRKYYFPIQFEYKSVKCLK